MREFLRRKCEIVPLQSSYRSSAEGIFGLGTQLYLPTVCHSRGAGPGLLSLRLAHVLSSFPNNYLRGGEERREWIEIAYVDESINECMDVWRSFWRNTNFSFWMRGPAFDTVAFKNIVLMSTFLPFLPIISSFLSLGILFRRFSHFPRNPSWPQRCLRIRSYPRPNHPHRCLPRHPTCQRLPNVSTIFFFSSPLSFLFLLSKCWPEHFSVFFLQNAMTPVYTSCKSEYRWMLNALPIFRSVRIFEAIKDKSPDDATYSYVVDQLNPVITELSLSTPEQLGL